MATLFLAYAPSEHQHASALAAGLRAAGHQVHTAPDPTGDAEWSAVHAQIQTTDAFLYAAPPGEAGSAAVVREREYADALGIPTLGVRLSGAGPATGIDFRAPDADAAFRLIGAIASLPPRPPAAARQAAPAAGPRAGAGAAASSKWAPPGSLTPDDVRRIGFRKAPLGRRGYDEESVDAFLDRVESDLRARRAGGSSVRVALTAADVHAIAFLRPPFGRRGYDEEQVDQFLDQVQRTFAALDRDLTARGTEVTKA